MNGVGVDHYGPGWEKISRRKRLSEPCCLCGQTDRSLLECHHIDGNKKNNATSNVVVLCRECHRRVHHDGIQIPKPHNKCELSVTVAHRTSSVEDWFNSSSSLKILPYFPPKEAMSFRKLHLKGFVSPGGCNFYVGLSVDDRLIGVMGFASPEMGSYDVLLKADTTISGLPHSTDLLLYVMRTRDVQGWLERRFNRKVATAYSMCFSQHPQIARYRKHGILTKKKEVRGGFDLGYTFDLGTIPSIKAAKAVFLQNIGKKQRRQGE